MTHNSLNINIKLFFRGIVLSSVSILFCENGLHAESNEVAQKIVVGAGTRSGSSGWVSLLAFGVSVVVV